MKAQGRGLPFTSQVLVEHPEQFLQHIKQCLSSKEGIPVKQQRLVFSGPGAQLLEESQEASIQQPAAEEILSSLNQWQAIIFQNGRAIGRSVNLKLYSCNLPESSLYKSEDSLAVECFALQLDAWHPSWKARTEDSSPLYIAVDEDFKNSSFHVQLIGRTSRGTNFALPFAYKFEGSAVSSRLDYYDQHVKRHQQSFASLHDTEVSGEYNIKFGEGLQSFTAVLDVVDQPHWLKSFILRFSVLVASKLDDQADPSVSRAITAQHSEAPSMAVPEQPSGGLVLSRSGSMHTQEGSKIAHSTAAGLSKAAEQVWLPAKLRPQKSDSGGKQKQPKKRSKQKSKLDMHSTQPAEDDQPSKNNDTELFRSKPAHAEEPKWELQHAECLEEAVNGKAFSDDSAEDHTCRMEGSFPESASHSEPNGHAAQSPHAKHRDVGSAAGAARKAAPPPVTPEGTMPDTAVRWRPSNPTGIKIRAGQGTAPPMHPALAQQKYVHPNAAKSARSGFTEGLFSPTLPSPGWRGNSWHGGHSSVSSLVVDAAGGDESSSWQSLSEDSDRSTSSEIDMTSPVSVGKGEAISKPAAGPGPGEPPRAISKSPQSPSSSCGPPLDQLLPGPVKNVAPKAPVSDAPSALRILNAPAAKPSAEPCAKPAAPFRVLSMNSDRSKSDRSHAQQGTARVAPPQPAAQGKGQKVQQSSEAPAESSYKAASKQPVVVRTEAPRTSSAATQPAGNKPRSPQKRSALAASSPFTSYPPGHPAALMPASVWAHMHQPQQGAHVPAAVSTGMPGMDSQLLIDVQRRLSQLEMAALAGPGSRIPVRTRSLPRLQQQEASSGTKQQQQQAQNGHAGQTYEQHRQAIMQQMPQMPPSWRQSPQLPTDPRQLLPKQASMHPVSTRTQRAVGADMHAPRRHSVPASPVVAAHSGPFPFHPHSEGYTANQLMQHMLSRNVLSSQGQPSRSMGMPAGQMLGYPAVRQRTPQYAEPHLQRAMHGPAVPTASQTVLSPPQPNLPTDIERFLSLSTPTLPSKGVAQPQLAHLWSFYGDASVFGKGIYTTGGSRGPSRAFFVPSLSAMQLFTFADYSAAQTGSLHMLSDAAAAQHPSWPKRMRLLKEVFEGAKPYERPALAQRIEQLAGESCAEGQPGSLLKDLPLQQLHPASWICVAWYPVYRIPDAPLTAKFLTYHSLTPVACSATHYGAVGLGPARKAPAAQPGSQVCLPTIGLKCCSLGDGSWLDDLPGVADGVHKILMRTPSLGSSSEDSSSVATSLDESHSSSMGSAGSLGLGIASSAPLWEGSQNRRARLAELSMRADWLSRREVIANGKGMQLHHDDQSFFLRSADKGMAAR